MAQWLGCYCSCPRLKFGYQRLQQVSVTPPLGDDPTPLASEASRVHPAPNTHNLNIISIKRHIFSKINGYYKV